MNWPIFLILALCAVQFLADFSGNFNIVHGNSDEREDLPPYKVNASSYEYSPGKTITVTITGDPGNVFCEFYVQALDNKTDARIGSWQKGPQSNPILNSAVIKEADLGEKQSVELKWDSPSEGNGYLDIWVKLRTNEGNYYWISYPDPFKGCIIDTNDEISCSFD